MKLPEHVNTDCFEELRLLLRKHGMEQVITCLAYLCSYNTGEKYMLDTALALLKAREAFSKRCLSYLDNKEVKLYKIRDRNTGLFSTGGIDPHWKSIGKVWYCEGHVKSALTNWATRGGNSIYDREKKRYVSVNREIPPSWEIVCFNLMSASQKILNAQDLHSRLPKK